MAEGILKHKLKALGLNRQIRVDSAGVMASPIKCRPDLRAQKVTLKHGIDISGLRSRRFSEKDFDHDHILVMDSEQQQYLADNCSELNAERIRLLLSYVRPHGEQQIPDPYYGNAQGFGHVYQLLDVATDALLQQLLKKTF